MTKGLTNLSVALWDKGMFGYNYPYQAGGTYLPPMRDAADPRLQQQLQQ